MKSINKFILVLTFIMISAQAMDQISERNNDKARKTIDVTAHLRKAQYKAYERSLDHAMHHAFNKAAKPIRNLVYNWLTKNLPDIKKGNTALDSESTFVFTPANIAYALQCDNTSKKSSEWAAIEACMQSKVDIEYVNKLIKRATDMYQELYDLPFENNERAKAEMLLQNAAVNWHKEETNIRKGLHTSKYDKWLMVNVDIDLE